MYMYNTTSKTQPEPNSKQIKFLGGEGGGGVFRLTPHLIVIPQQSTLISHILRAGCVRLTGTLVFRYFAVIIFVICYLGDRYTYTPWCSIAVYC